jgi:hypothetical protein
MKRGIIVSVKSPSLAFVYPLVIIFIFRIGFCDMHGIVGLVDQTTVLSYRAVARRAPLDVWERKSRMCEVTNGWIGR